MSKIALYIRLSVDDLIKKDESESITNQRAFLHDYLNRQDDLKQLEREEYVDDGYSGTTDHRPSFQRLLEDIKNRKVKTVIVKDLSRFYRDYIALGDYLENIFPFLGVRFIAINDGYDSNHEKGNGTDLDIQFKSLLYDFYCKDASEKVKTVSNELKRQGKFLAWNPSFGYIKDPNDKYKIIVDEKTAWVVRKIFDLALEGKGNLAIARILNEENIKTPSARRKEVSGNDYSYHIIQTGQSKEPIWSAGKVNTILINENYTGTYVYNTVAKNLMTKKVKVLPSDQWERVYNHHEAIVTCEEFERVKTARIKRRFLSGKNTNYGWRQKSPLQGIAICPKCHHILRIDRTKRKLSDGTEKIHQYFRCSTCATTSDRRESSKVELIEEQALKLIQERYGTPNEVKEKEKKIDYTKEIQKLEDLKVAYFEKYKQGTLTKQSFLEKKSQLTDQIKNMEKSKVENDKVEEQVPTNKLTKELVERYIESLQCEASEIKNVIWKEERV